ncbi:unnamed protein product [Dibothriocephalus latus]|uniref:Uncharacterized protein n=1 Tax=Dibothriocephalus latus TaxID=60516 RepID=A0A3P7NT41_DIBLA|nr:unnamed protein product [Dibothriocephalus latus]
MGPRLEHVFLIENTGKPELDNATLQLDIPVSTNDGDLFVYLSDRVRRQPNAHSTIHTQSEVLQNLKLEPPFCWLEVQHRIIEPRASCSVGCHLVYVADLPDRNRQDKEPVVLRLLTRKLYVRSPEVALPGIGFGYLVMVITPEIAHKYLEWVSTLPRVVSADGRVAGTCTIDPNFVDPLNVTIMDIPQDGSPYKRVAVVNRAAAPLGTTDPPQVPPEDKSSNIPNGRWLAQWRGGFLEYLHLSVPPAHQFKDSAHYTELLLYESLLVGRNIDSVAIPLRAVIA